MCEINSFAIVYFFFDDRQQTAWSQGSSKYQKQKIKVTIMKKDAKEKFENNLDNFLLNNS
jgi:hypothetical protein